MFTYDCIPEHVSNSIIKFADATMVVSLISDDYETVYRNKVRHLAVWCTNNNLTVNTKKTRKLIKEHRWNVKGITHTPIYIDGAEVEHVTSFTVLGGPQNRNFFLEPQHLYSGQKGIYLLRKHLPPHILDHWNNHNKLQSSVVWPKKTFSRW